ncbi:MAG: GGDEF domain-containing protein [Syntrophomonas sp.]|nr:GGDEF domain-containing protein [Syntrophomonas sp.]
MYDGLVSRKELIDTVNLLISKGDGPFSVAELDLDNFGFINNVHGKELGDDIIKKLTSILKMNTADNDLICRQGDQFTILLISKSAERGFMDMEEIRRYLSDNTFSFQGKDKTEDVYITFSCGIASYPRDAKNSVELLRIADSAMFRGKKLGKNKVCLSEAESMALKSSYFTKTQLDRLAALSKTNEKTEAFLLREALDDLFKKYSQ